MIDCYTSWDAEAGARSLRVEAAWGTLDPVVVDCYGDIYEYQRILVYDASGLGTGNYEIDRR